MKTASKTQSILGNQEAIFIIAYNALTLYLYHFGDLEPIYVIWAYYLQSLNIGARYWFLELFHQIRSKEKQWHLTLFFPIHYGGFHLGYFVFLIIMSADANLGPLVYFLKINFWILVTQLVVFIIQELSPQTPYHTRVSFFAPYVRIIPMHIIIILGFNMGYFDFNAFDLFIILKTFVDLISYRWFEKRELKRI